jgi:predicted HAD superfamily phosphohydrolase
MNMCEYAVYVSTSWTLRHPTLEQAFAELHTWTSIFAVSDGIRITWSPMRVLRKYYIFEVNLDGIVVRPMDRMRETPISVDNIPIVSEKLVEELMRLRVALKMGPKPKHEELVKEVEDVVVQVFKELR